MPDAVLSSRPWASGAGSMPGTDPVGTLGAVLDLLTAPHVPFLPELPDRGVGADMIGRGAALLVDLPVDLQPAGWRLVDRPGRDLARARAWWRQDLDVLAERAEGYRGPLTVTAAGPWTLAASLERPRGGAAAGDRGARRDLAESLAEGLVGVLADVARAAPGVRPVLQLDEPSLPAVLAGRLPTPSGYGRLPAVDALEVEAALAGVVAVARSAGAGAVALHCCARDAPVGLLARVGADVVGVDVSADLRTGAAPAPERWERLAAAVERGVRLALGVVDPRVPAGGSGSAALADRLARHWRGTGMAPGSLTGTGITPGCGLAGAGAGALAVLRSCVEVADGLAESLEEAA
ncbi:MAG: methionine synthase [Kineosporiaceae bacterium]